MPMSNSTIKHIWAAAAVVLVAVVAAASAVANNSSGAIERTAKVVVNDAGIAETVVADLAPLLAERTVVGPDGIAATEPSNCPGDIICDSVNPPQCGDCDDIWATTNGRRVNPDDHTEVVALDAEDDRATITEYAPPVFPADVVEEGKADHKWMTIEQARAAMGKTQWQHDLVFEDAGFWVPLVTSWMPHAGSSARLTSVTRYAAQTTRRMAAASYAAITPSSGRQSSSG